MAKHKKPKTWAEEIADLDDPAPKDLDPEQPDEGNSSEDGGDDHAKAKDHYVDVGKSHLRKTGAISLGPEYSGSHVSRDNLLEPVEVNHDDPFASARNRQGSSSDANDSGEYADPDNVDLDKGNNIDQNEEVDNDDAFGDGDEERFKDFTFRGPTTVHQDSPEQEQVNGNTEGNGIHKDSAGFSDMDSADMDTATITNFVNGKDGSSAETQSGSEVAMDDAEDTEMGVNKSLTSSEADDSESETSSSNANNVSRRPHADDNRAALRKMMAESQKVITSNLSKAAKSDIAKGRAIKRQHTAFDTLLNTRIRIQKALVATNSLHTPSSPSTPPPDPAVTAAEQAALKLWTTLDSLRQSLHPVPSPPQAFLEPSSTTPLSTLWTRMQSHESQSRPQRTSTLNKWSARTAPASSLPRSDKFSAIPTQQPLSAVLEQQLASTTTMEKLVAKTRIPRSCAPPTTAASSTEPHNSSIKTPETTTMTQPIYDDTDFYSLLLRDLVSSRSSDPSLHSSSLPPSFSYTIQGIKDPSSRVRKTVDTKASKGRKIRYTVHEKLQNYMAPEDRGGWGERQREELVRGLLGRRVLGGGEGGGGGDGDGDDGEREEEGLRLFR